MIDVSKPLQRANHNGKTEELGTFNNPTAVVDRQSGAIHLLFCQSYGRLFHASSHDDGLTWTKPVEITSVLEGLPADVSRKVFSPGPGHGIQLQSGPHAGRLLMSLRLSNGEGPNHTRPCWVSTLYSDDAGQSWQTGAIVTSDFAGHADMRYPMEGTVAELEGGRVMMNLRNEAPVFRRLVATSPDGISDWTVPRVDQTLVEPMVFGSLLRFGATPNGAARLLFVNPASERARPGKPALRFRENLTVRLSDDEGASWPRSLVIEPGLAGYADLAIARDGAILCAYERGDLREEGFGSIPLAITVARFDESALVEGAR